MSRSKPELKERGQQVARVLSGAWRSELPIEPPRLDELAPILPQLLATGAGPLAWRRVRGTPLAGEASLAELRSAHRLAALSVRLHEVELARLFGSLRNRGLRPLLVKGWAIARAYPEPALRPYGDLDLLFPPDEWSEADRVLETLVSPQQPVEAHVAGEGSYRAVPAADWTAVRQRSERIELEGVEIEVPAGEDHFRILCAHLLAHGAWRPLWLADLAVVVENQSAGWDWEYLLRGPASEAGWLGVCLQLTVELLGAMPTHVPDEVLRRPLPAWVGETVLRQWGTGTGGSRREALNLQDLKRKTLRGGLRDELLGHWPNPIQASFELRTPVTGTYPRLVQLAAAASRLPRLIQRLSRPG